MSINISSFSWDCDGQGNCSDPGNGTGQYSSLSLVNSCVVPSWDCDNQGNCYDPGMVLVNIVVYLLVRVVV